MNPYAGAAANAQAYSGQNFNPAASNVYAPSFVPQGDVMGYVDQGQDEEQYYDDGNQGGYYDESGNWIDTDYEEGPEGGEEQYYDEGQEEYGPADGGYMQGEDPYDEQVLSRLSCFSF